MKEPPPSPLIQLHVDFGSGARGLACYRDESHQISETTADDVSQFRAATTAIHLGSALLFESRATAMQLHRAPHHIARGDIDHLQLQLPIAGRLGKRDHLLFPGDLGLHDMSRAGAHRVLPDDSAPAAHFLMLMLPRARLAPLVSGRLDGADGLRLAATSGYAQLMGSTLRALHRHAAAMSEPERAAAVRAMALLVAAALDEARAPLEPGSPSAHTRRRAQLELIKRALDEELPDELNLRALCRRFGLSRATLYRLFEEDGGIARYLRERRLQRAARVLLAPEHQHLRILDIAVDHHFGSDTAFIRAFKRRFGLSPAALRQQARAGHPGPVVRAPDRALEQSDVLRWIRTL